MSHPSEEVIQEARWRLDLRNRGAAEFERFRKLSREFLGDSEFDSFGLRQCLLEMDRLAGTPEPSAGKGLRDRIGALMASQQPPMRVPARALKAVDAILRHQHRRQRDLEEKLSNLESRIKRIEGGKA